MTAAVHVGAATSERSILFSASLCCCCVQFRTRLHCCMWIQSCRHVWACVCVCERVLLSVCRRGVVVAHCTVANLLCMWMRNSFPECVFLCGWECLCFSMPACVGVCVSVYVTLLWQSANQANCSKMTFGTRQLQKPSSCRGRSGTDVDGEGAQAMILSNCCADAEAELEQLSELELQLKLDWDAANGQSKTHSTGNFGFALWRHRQLCWQIDSRSPFRSRCGCLGICPVNRRRRQVAPSLNCTANPKFAVRRMSKTFKMLEKLAAQGISLHFPQLLVCALQIRNLLITFR